MELTTSSDRDKAKRAMEAMMTKVDYCRLNRFCDGKKWAGQALLGEWLRSRSCCVQRFPTLP